MRDANRLRKWARRVFLEANEAELHGQSGYADRLRFRARQFSDDAAVIEAAETRLEAERPGHERKVPRSGRILPVPPHRSGDAII